MHSHIALAGRVPCQPPKAGLTRRLRSLVNIPLEYVDVAIDDALDTMRPPKDFVAVAGTSRGGELALLVGATFPKVRAVVGIMASGLVMGAFGDPGPNVSTPSAAWTLAKKPVPDLFAGNPRVDWTDSKQEVSLVPGYLAAMKDAPSVERATIPVERIRGPVLLVTGKDDRLAPRFELAEIARRRLEQHRHPCPYEHLSYENAGHTVAPPYAPATADTFVHPVRKEVMALGGTTEGRAQQRGLVAEGVGLSPGSVSVPKRVNARRLNYGIQPAALRAAADTADRPKCSQCGKGGSCGR